MITGYFEVVAIRDHKPIHQSQLQFKKGEKILVVETAPTGWWRGEIGQRKGLFPESYVQPTGATPTPTTPSTPSEIASPIPTSPAVPSMTTPTVSTKPVVQQQQQQHSNSTSGNNTPPLSSLAQVNISGGSNSSSTNSSANNTLRSTILTNNTNGKPSTSTTTTTNGNGVSFSEPPAVTISLASISPIDSPSIESPANRSPRFNISKSDIENSTPMVKHSRKNSGPSKSIDFNNESNDNDTSVGGSGGSGGNSETNSNGGGSGTNTPPRKAHPQYSSATVNVNPYKELMNQQQQPQSTQKVKSRTPLNQNSGRITVEDVNTQVPYYISRAIESHAKQSFDELEFATGDLIVVYNAKNVESDWWVGRFKNIYGVFPKKCVEIIKDISPSPESIVSNKTVNNTTSSPSTPITSTTPTTITPTQSTISLPSVHSSNNNNITTPQSQPSTYINTYSQIQSSSSSSTPLANQSSPIPQQGYNSNNSFYKSEFKKAIAIANYNSQFATYLSLKKGDVLVLESKEGEFWKARIGPHVGLVSPNFIREIENPPQLPPSVNNHNPLSNSQPIYNNNTYSNSSSSNTTATTTIQPPPSSQPTVDTIPPKSQTPQIPSTPVASIQPQTQTQPISTDNNDDEAIAKKIRDSFVHFQSKEELLEAIQNLAIKFVKQSSILKKELAQEQSQRKELEEELKFIKHKYNIN